MTINQKRFVWRSFFFIVITILMIFFVINSINDAIYKKEQIELRRNLTSLSETSYTKDEAFIDFEMRDGEIKLIKIDVDALMQLTKDNEERIDSIEERQMTIDTSVPYDEFPTINIAP